MWLIFRKIIGQKYVMNKTSGEVHKLKKVNKACGVHKMSEKNKLYLTTRKYSKIRSSELFSDGCIHCNKEYNTD